MVYIFWRGPSREYGYELGYHLRRQAIYDTDYVLVQDIFAYDKMRRDAVMAHIIQYRKHLVAGAEFHCDPASDSDDDKRVAEIMADMLGEVQNFAEARFNLSTAFLMCLTWAHIGGEFKTKDFGGTGKRKWWVCTQLRDVDKRRFELRRFQDLANPNNPRNDRWLWNVMHPWDAQYQPINRSHWIKLTYDNAEETLRWGRGLGEALYTYWYLKTVTFKKLATHLDRWTGGMLVAKIANTDAAVDVTREDKRTQWFDTLKKMRANNILVGSIEDELQVVDAPMGGYNAGLEFIKYLDESATQLVLGSIRPTGGGEGGSYNRAQTEADTTQLLVNYDRKMLAEAISRDLIGLLWRANRPNWVALGLENAKSPKFRIGSEPVWNEPERAGVATQLVQSGLKLKLDEVYKQTGWTMPSEDDDVFGPDDLAAVQKAQQEAMGGGMGGFPGMEEEGGGEEMPEGGGEFSALQRRNGGVSSGLGARR